jgi:signal peptidase II
MVSRFLLALISVAVIDRIAKVLAIMFLPYSVNTGTLFGMLQNTNLIFIFVAVAIMAGLLYWYFRFANESALNDTAAGLVMGGAIGNLVDRLAYGGVIDFIDLKIWPSFNIADSALVAGLCLLAFKNLKK